MQPIPKPQNPHFSDDDIQQMLRQYEQRLQISAAMTQLQAETYEQLHAQAKPTLTGVPDFPPEPDGWQTWVTIPKQYAVEGAKHVGDSAGILAGIPKLLFTDEGRALTCPAQRCGHQ